MRRVLIPALAALVTPSLADWLYTQPWDGVSGGRLSTVYSNAPNLSTYQFDNFHISSSNVSPVTAIGFNGVDTGDTSADQGYGFSIQTAPGWGAGTVVRQLEVGPGSSIYHGGWLIFSLVPADLFLPAGDYYVTAWIKRPTGHGNWLWRATTPVIGGEAIYHNPGGGQGFGTNPIPGSAVYGQARDMAFTIESYIPEPASIAALMLGVPVIWRKLRRECASDVEQA